MAINFPSSPTDNQTHTENGSTWEYSVEAGGVWITVPQTVTGPTGPTGSSGNIQVGTITTGAEGTLVIVTNSGNGTHAILNFTIPRGNVGNTGLMGSNGSNGTNGTNGLSRPMSITLEYPTNAEKVPMLYTHQGFIISRIQSALIGTSTPSVTFSVRYDANLQATGTEVVTSGITTTNVNFGLSTTSFNNATVPANNWVWITTSAVSGTVTSLAITLMA